jgi:repressor LexA
MAITRRQFEVLRWIASSISQNGYSPSYAEIGRSLGLSSLATVHKYISKLFSKGYLTMYSNRSRSIELTHKAKWLLRSKSNLLNQAEALRRLK